MPRRTLVRARPPAAPPAVGSGRGLTSGGGSLTDAGMYWTGGSGWPTAGPYVSAQDVAGLPAAGRALNLIAGTVVQMPLIDRMGDGTEWPANPVLVDPWPMMGRAEWLTYQVHALMMHGDAIALPADYGDDGYPRQLIPVDPQSVDVYRASDGTVVYDLYTTAGTVSLGRADVWHAKGLFLTSDGLRGIGVVPHYRTATAFAVALQRYGLSTFGAGVPSGIVKVQLREVSPEQAAQIKDDWRAAFVDRVPAVLSQLMDFTPISWSPQDAEYLATARLSVADVAFMFNLDPTDLDTSLGSAMTYANREQRAYERLLTSIGPLLVRIEQAYRFLVPRGHQPTFDRQVVLWADSRTQAEVENIQLANGSLTLNEVRARAGRPLYATWADQPFAAAPQLEGAP